MVKYKVKWSIEARLDLIDILDFYTQRNGNAVYSKKLFLKINKSIGHIIRHPSLGLQTYIASVRVLVAGDYQLIYEIAENTILIVMVWDCKRNPHEKLLSTRIK
jgi:toxin YoeB